MATHTLVNPLSNEAAALIGLVLRSQGIPVSEEFWMISSEPHQKLLVLVSPEADTPKVRDLYERIFASLSGIDFASQEFVRTSLLVFGERESRDFLAKIHSGYTGYLQVGPYENAEVLPIPPASEIRMSGMLHFIPSTSTTTGSYTPFPCGVLFSAFSAGGWMKPREIQDWPGLYEILESLKVPSHEDKRIREDVKYGRPSHTVLSDIGLEALYQLRLV